jgi:hypothetical protein
MENPQIVAMRRLGMTEEEIADVLKTDKEIDQGAKHFELTADQKKTEKKMRQAERKVVDAYGKASTKVKKVDDDKVELIQKLAATLTQDAESLEITNAQREINFTYNGKKYKIVLSAPRN